MNLSNPRFEYIDIRNEFVDLLRNNLSEINQDLNVEIKDAFQQIKKGGLFKVMDCNNSNQFPFIYVDFDRSNTSNKTQCGRRNGDLFLNVYVIARLANDSGYDDDDEKVVLMDNIKSVLYQNTQFTTKILFIGNVLTTYSLPIQPDVFMSGGIINVELKKEII
jgi:hypothetical protein